MKEKPIPDFINKIIEDKTGDATNLSDKQQDILFLGDLRMGNADLKDYADGNMTIQDLWADYWWQGKDEDRNKRIAQFNTSLEKYNKENG